MSSRSTAEKSTIDLVVPDSVELVRFRRAMYFIRSITFSHVGRNYTGTVVSVRPHGEEGSASWLVRLRAEPHVDVPPKRATLKRIRRADGESVVH